jgi:sugar O-acyltransferase (sialic acid O-acetyltransferase NeuD family)
MKPLLPIILLGAGGHAKVLIDALRLQSTEILGIVDLDPNKKGLEFMGVPIIGNDTEVMKYPPQKIRLVNGIGSVCVSSLRRQLFESFNCKGYQFESVIHPSAIIANQVTLSEGVQIMAGVVIQAGCQIGVNAIINTGSLVDHDCLIGRHVHIAPGVVISGGVVVDENAHIGTGAVIIQDVRVGSNSLVAAGAVVTRGVSSNLTVAGVPARELRR